MTITEAPADLWQAITERLNPAKARPVLRDGIEIARLTSVRGDAYAMLRSPDAGATPCYLRLRPEELELAERMDGSRTVATLIAEFARISGRLAPDQVVRVVADLAANRMLNELPVDAFAALDRVRRRSVPARIGRGLLAAAKGRRFVLGNIDRLAGTLYRVGGRALFTRHAAIVLAVIALAGLALFVRTWVSGAESLFLSGSSYATGGLVLLACNFVALACHELGHALGAKHAGRRVPAAGVMLYFGMPAAFVDTTDVWMADRRARMLTSAAGPIAALSLAGVVQLVALGVPELGALAFKLAFAWYLNSLFNLNPLLALDGYYLLMDWLEVANLRARGIAYVLARRRPKWATLDREGRIVALYGCLSALWLVIFVGLMVRLHRDRVAGVFSGLWHSGWASRLLFVVLVAALLAPLVHVAVRTVGRRLRRALAAWRERRREADQPRRLDALRATVLSALPAASLERLAGAARWVRPRRSGLVLAAGAPVLAVYVVVDGALEGRLPGDPPGSLRERATPGQLVGTDAAPSTLAWTATDARLVSIPSSELVAIGPLPEPELATVDAITHDTPADCLHLSDDYPPLYASPGAAASDDEVDRRLSRRLAMLVLLAALLALISVGVAVAPGIKRAETPPGRAALPAAAGAAPVVPAVPVEPGQPTIAAPPAPSGSTTPSPATTTASDPATTPTTRPDPPTTTTTTTTRTAVNAPPRFDRVEALPPTITQLGRACPPGSTSSRVIAVVGDRETAAGGLTVILAYVLDTDPAVRGRVRMAWTAGAQRYEGTLGPFDAGGTPDPGGVLTVTVTATDPAGGVATSAIKVTLGRC